MAYNFPNAPLYGDIFDRYKWDGEKWVLAVGGRALPSTFVPATWNPADSIRATFSNSDRTFTVAGSNGCARSTAGKSAGKYFWELTTGANNINDFLGMASGSVTMPIVPSNANSIGIDGLNRFWIGAGGLYGGGSISGLDLSAMAFAVNIPAGLFWVKSAGTGWIGSSLTADPATDLNGASFSGFSLPVFPFARFAAGGIFATANFGSGSFATAVPAGYTPGWPAGVTALSPPLDAVASVTGAWSLSRDMLTSFAAGTRYTKVGSEIDSLKDQSGNSRHFTDSGNFNRRPAEVTAFPAGILCADFNGVDDALQTVAISNLIANNSGAMVVSVIVDAVTQNSVALYQNHGILADHLGYIGLFARALSGMTVYSYNYDGTEDVATTTGSVGTPYVLMWRHHGGNIYFSVNGGTEVSTASGNTANMTGFLFLGSGTAYANIKVAEVFTTNDGSQTAALATAIANMKSYVGA